MVFFLSSLCFEIVFVCGDSFVGVGIMNRREKRRMEDRGVEKGYGKLEVVLVVLLC